MDPEVTAWGAFPETSLMGKRVKSLQRVEKQSLGIPECREG